MIDNKIKTLLTLIKAGSYTKAAKHLSLTQPAVSHHIRQLEKEYGIKIFYNTKKELKATPEGKILIEYAYKVVALTESVKKAIKDYRRSTRSFTVGITTTLGEYLIARIFSLYCKEHPNTHINIVTDSIKNIFRNNNI